jgi:SPP1 gp7 family putative phage head morphogenesis protein
VTAVWTVHTARGPAGTITDTGNGLVASTPGLQSMADVAARRGAAAYLDGYSNGYVWTEPSGHTSKAAAAGGDADPKVPPTPPTGPAGQPVPPAPPTPAAWPGWVYDLTLASVYTDQITQAFKAATSNATGLLRDWWAGRLAATRQGLVDLISDGIGAHVGATLRRLWTEAWYLGHHSARGIARQEIPDWGTWTPGDLEAAQGIATAPRLQALLASHGISMIRSIAQTRMQDLADEIADAVANGDSWEDLAGRLESILRVPQRAPMIARTEIARAVTAASFDQYIEHGVEGKEWAVAPDERVCPVCRRNEAEGGIPLLALFPSGDLGPPGHPNCRCAPMPTVVHGLDITGTWPKPVVKAEDLNGYEDVLAQHQAALAEAVIKAAWEHELRGSHGHWVRSGAGEEISEHAGQWARDHAGTLHPRELRFDEATQYRQEHLDPAFHYTPGQAKAIQAYTGPEYTAVNGGLRADGDGGPVAAALSSAMQPLPEDLTLLRQIEGPMTFDGLARGDVIADPGFSSTTLSPGGRFASNRSGTTVMHIMTPAGTPVVWTGTAAEFPENEVILDAGQPLAFLKSGPHPGRVDVTDAYFVALPKSVAA